MLNKEIKAIYEINQYIKFNYDNENNYLDLKNNIFLRETKEYNMKIDINNKNIYLKLKENNYEVSSEIDCELKKMNNGYIIKYNISLEEIKILIHIL